MYTVLEILVGYFEKPVWQGVKSDLKAFGVCRIEADKVTMVWENVLFSLLRNINSDSLNGESVYGNSMVTEMSSLLANT